MSIDLMVSLAEVAAHIHQNVEQPKADNTKRAYRAGWADFTAWCDGHRLASVSSVSSASASAG